MKSEDNCFLVGRKAMINLDSVLKAEILLLTKVHIYSQGHGLPSGRVRLWELDHKEGRMPKNLCLWTVMLEKTSESPLNIKGTKPVILKGNQPWILVERTDAEAEAPVFGSSDVNSSEKSLMLGKIEDRRRRRRSQRMRWLDSITNAMDMNLGKLWEMVWGKGGLASHSPRGRKRVRLDWATKQQQQWLQQERYQVLWRTEDDYHDGIHGYIEKVACGLVKRDFMRTQGRQYQWRRKQEPIHRDWEDLHVFREWQPTLVGTQSSCLKLLGSQPTPVLLPGKNPMDGGAW